MPSKRTIILLFCIIVIAVTVFADQGRNSDLLRCYDINPSYLITSSISQSRPIIQPHPHRDPVGETEQIGSTYYDSQHNGTISKMIAVDPNGGIHVTWMKSFDANQYNRRMMYNCLPPDSSEWLGPAVADNSNRAGYGHVAILPEDNRGVVFCHSDCPCLCGDELMSTMCMDYAPYIGAFDTEWAPNLPDKDLIWPKCSIDQSNRAHMIATESSPDNVMWQRVVYWRGVAVDGEDFQIWEWTEAPIIIDTTGVISSISSASRQSNKVVLAWHHNRVDPGMDCWDENRGAYQRNNDIRYVVLEDGEEFDREEHEILSMTKIRRPDPALWDVEPDIEFDPLNPEINSMAYGDIWRPYCDIDIQFDPWNGGDEMYASFAACAMFERPWVDDEGNVIDGMTSEHNLLWFWNSVEDTITLVANGYYPNRTDNGGTWHSRCGGWRMNADRPSIAFDLETEGRIFVTWVSFPQIMRSNPEYEEDPNNELPFLYDFEFASDTSSDGYSNADVMVSVSEDYGITWLEPVNITNTRWEGEEAPEPGECQSEAWQSVAVDAHNGALHLLYVQDTDAGATPQDEGATTNSPVLYHRVDIEDLNIDELEPLELPFEGFQFHNNTIEDEEAVKDNNELPTDFQLIAIYPNPFNSSAVIKYQLPHSTHVTVRIFDTNGRNVNTLVNEQTEAGNHQISWNAIDQPTGMYFAQLQADGITRMIKLLLVK